MRCLTCQAENLADARFCDACGAPLEATCSACGARNRPTAHFCRACRAPLTGPPQQAAASPAAYTPTHLATKILTTRSALEGERKQVTVLFADVKGSMELAEQVDPEEWHRIMERFFLILTEGVHRFEGTINQYTGDGIMALFGAPIAHEDHAQRACYAALYLRDALRAYADEVRLNNGLNFSVRTGMNSGEVVVGKIGDDLRMDYTAQGHAVGLAARMEQLAEPGTVLLTAHTAKLVSGYFALRNLGGSTIKGVSEPVQVYRLEGIGALHTRFEQSRARGFSRFVGREQETAVLEAALARTITGEGQVVGIVAEPGAGKSRLCYEFTQHCRRRGLEVITAAAMPHGRAVPFLPVLQILRALCGIAERESAEDTRRKIAGALLWRDETFRDDLPLLFDFLGVSDPDHPSPRAEPEVLQRRLFSVIQRLIQTRRRGSPMVLLFEDLHWIDGASAAALEHLIEAVPATRTFLLVNFRPEYHAGWMSRSHYQQLALHPLGAEAAAALLADLLGSDSSLAELAERIRERAAGNPFFIEEIVQSLAETGALAGTRGAYQRAAPVTEMVLPVSVQAGLAARIDRLSDAEKQVLQAAAVIGKEFGEAVLQRVAERAPVEVATALRALVAADFIYQAALYPESQYAFKHPLTQEVAYRSQLSERRAHRHAGVARAIEALFPEKLDEYAALLAQHWKQAGDAAAAAEWHVRAAVWVGVRDRAEMLRHWRKVRELLDTVPASPETLRPRVLARIQILHNRLFVGQAEDDAATLFREGVELATRLDDRQLHIWLLGEYAMAQQQAGALAEALTLADEGVRLADAGGETVLQLMIRVALLWVLLQSGRLHAVIAASDEAERLSRGDPEVGADVLGFSPLGSVLTLRAAALAFLGQLAEATAAVERAIAIGQRRQDAEVLNWAHTWGVQVCWISGDAARALRHGQSAVEFGEVTGSAGLRAVACVALARAYLLNERYAEARDALNRDRSLAANLDVEESLHSSVLARAYLGLRDLTRAREAADRAVAQAGQCPTIAVAARLARAEVLSAIDGAGGCADIEADLCDAAQLIEAMGARGLTPCVHEQRAALARLCGDEAARHRELREAHRLFSSIGAVGHAARIARDLEPG